MRASERYVGKFRLHWIRWPVRLVALVIGLILSVVGCGPSNATEATAADIRGTITYIQRANSQSRKKGIIGSVLIEGVMEVGTKLDKASVTVTDKTRIFEQKGHSRHLVEFEYLKIGLRVQAQFTGPVAQSYPVQAMASEIVILE
jgi:hypothetical protein